MSMRFVDMTIEDESEKLFPIKKSSLIKRAAIYIGICTLILLILIITIGIFRNLPIQLLSLIIISIIAVALAICIICIQFSRKIKHNNVRSIQTESKTLPRIVNMTSISLSIFTLLLSAFVMAPLNFGYGSFGTFMLYFIYMFTVIWMITLIIYILIIILHFVWNKCYFIRQQLSNGAVSFFLASFISLPIFMSISAIIAGSSLYGFGLGIALSLSLTLFISGIIIAILHSEKRTKIIHILLAVIGCVGIVLVLWIYIIDGFDQKIVVMIPSERYPRNLTNDPSLDGNYSIGFLTYGSGFDHRSEYGKKVSILTPTIDLSSIITLSLFNRRTFKYNEAALPLNGRIWYPTNSNNNTGPYPVVILLHGNHVSTESSEIGYDYLGTMLASQGFISVSIDENFLNVGPMYSSITFGKISVIKKYGFGLSNGPELMARAIIILETLKQLRLWNTQTSNLFYNKIDLFNVGLMGHSRAGEAVVIAQVFNRLKYIPDFPSGISLTDYDFGIKAIFSISGTDDAYMPLGYSLESKDVTMFGIHGVYDGDLSSFFFQAKLRNLRFTSNSSQYNFKASLYVHQANHGQFNSDWGRYDLIPGANRFMNVRPIMPIEQQQKICKIYMAALMNLVLKNQTQYRVLFEDYRSAMIYLPYTNYISTFQDSNETVIADFENYDVTQGTIPNSKINVTNMLLWSSVYVKVYRSAMLIIQPMNTFVGKYSIYLQNALDGSSVRFSIGRTPECLVDHLTITLFYENGISDSFVVHVLPTLAKRIFKTGSLEDITAVQTISLPMSHPIIGLEFVVDGTDGQFLIDNIIVAN